MIRRRTWCAAAVVLVLALAPAQAETWTIAVVRDGPVPEHDVTELVERELVRHLPRGAEATWKRDPSFDAGWDPSRARGALESALADEDVDLVLAVGALVTAAAAAADLELDRPVVSAFVQRFDFLRLPSGDDGRPLEANLSFIVAARPVRRELETFRSLVPFETLHVVVGASHLEALGRDGVLAGLGDELGVRIELVAVGADTAPLLAADGLEAVALGHTPRLAEADRRGLIEELNRRGVPTWSLVGHRDVELGALAALTGDVADQQVRRVALNLAQLIRGRTTAELPVALTVDSKLLVNARTARSVGYVPDPETRLFASFLHPEAFEEAAETIDLETAFELAVAGNKALSVEDTVVESIRQDAGIARSFLRPQVRADLRHLETDADFSLPVEGTRGILSLRQMIWDDATVSTHRAARRLVAVSEEEREAFRLDVVADTGRAFYNLALNRALFQVELENRRLTEDFLEIARLREAVGYAGRDEILRWEAALADQKSALYRGLETVETSRIAFNQLLGTRQDRRFQPAVDELEASENFPEPGRRFAELFDEHTSRPRLRDALVDRALGASPEVRALREALAAQEIRLGAAKRRYVVPSLFADLSYSAEIDGDPGAIPLLDDDDSASLSLIASYPIFEGGRRAHQVRKAEVDLEGLERRLELVEERVEQRTRTAVRQLESSFPRILLSRSAARSAVENLALVEDQYVEGLVNVTDLLSAQNQKFVADQFATIALYEFLLDLVDLQRALGWFAAEKTPQEREELVEALRSALSNGSKS